jgi:two-component system response regulator AlgR
MDGIEVARHLAALDQPPAVVFTTAYDEHALEAFDTQAVGYLLKPVRREKLARAVRHAGRVASPQLRRLAERSQLGRRRGQICARIGQRMTMIPVEEILYFVAGQKYVTVRSRGGEALIEDSLRSLGEEFAPDFVRIHRNSLVALRHISSIERNEEGQLFVRVEGCTEPLPVSRRHSATALRQIRGGR